MKNALWKKEERVGTRLRKIKSSKDNWEELTSFFDFPVEIHKIIYTTNAIESLNSTIWKYSKVRTVFPDDQAAQKAAYQLVANVEKKWTMPVREWGAIITSSHQHISTSAHQ